MIKARMRPSGQLRTKFLSGKKYVRKNKNEANNGVFPWEDIQWYGNLRVRRGPPFLSRLISIELTESIPRIQAISSNNY